MLAFALLAAIAGRGRRRPEPAVARSSTAPAAGLATGPAIRPALGLSIGPATGPAAEPAAEPAFHAAAGPGAGSAIRPAAGLPIGPATHPAAGPSTEPATGPGADPVAAGIAFRSAAMRRALAAARATTTETKPAVEAAGMSASDEQRFAEELATAATRAGVTADKRQAEWESAQRAVDAAWQAYEEAEAVATRAIRAAAFPVPGTPLTPAEFADRERYLHRAAQAAQARGELSTDQLIDALSHRNGFDPRLHPFEQDALLRRLGRDRMLQAFKDAGERERAAWRAAEQAQAAKRSLDREAAAAALNVAPGPEPASASRHIRVTTPVLSLR
ncbi:hypothetical protein Vau01_008680 [Virgisporangium aurantiacum]|uniref:Uncharacterized protein n=1 Tax=Virgisporangium aurantiacum TaxID=175570 RepID=A0A8J4DYS8_9ACTN|nr:hypothetical protein Vau01_008680 [Virgisporangium aurantiacum]